MSIIKKIMNRKQKIQEIEKKIKEVDLISRRAKIKIAKLRERIKKL